MKTIIIFLLLLVVSFLPASSQNDTLRLNRETALEMALENNPAIAIARLEKARAEARVNQNRGNLLPSLNASGSYTRNLKKQVIFLPEELAPVFGGTALQVNGANLVCYLYFLYFPCFVFRG